MYRSVFPFIQKGKTFTICCQKMHWKLSRHEPSLLQWAVPGWKGNPGWRPVNDLLRINKFVVHTRMKMETIYLVLAQSFDSTPSLYPSLHSSLDLGAQKGCLHSPLSGWWLVIADYLPHLLEHQHLLLQFCQDIGNVIHGEKTDQADVSCSLPKNAGGQHPGEGAPIRLFDHQIPGRSYLVLISSKTISEALATAAWHMSFPEYFVYLGRLTMVSS